MFRCDDGIHVVFACIHSNGAVKVNDGAHAVPTFCSFSVGFCFCFCFGFFAICRILLAFASTPANTHANWCPKKKRTKKKETRYRHKIGWLLLSCSFVNVVWCLRATHLVKLKFCIFAKKRQTLCTNGSKWWSKRWKCDKAYQTRSNESMNVTLQFWSPISDRSVFVAANCYQMSSR